MAVRTIKGILPASTYGKGESRTTHLLVKATEEGKNLVLIEAWNEVGEGSYLVPTTGDGTR